jgi:zinc/manganese transport system ATP-binding protein
LVVHVAFSADEPMIQTQALLWGPPGRPLTPPLDLSIAEGSLTAVLGVNGSGKSSLIQVLAGLKRPLAGRVQVGAARLGAVAYLPQQPQLDRQYPMDLATLVSAGLWRSRANRAEQKLRVSKALEDWQLDGLQRQPLGALSGGELQRALLARLTLQDARLLLLDEPEAALDETGRRIFWTQVERWQKDGRTVLLVGHDHRSICQHVSDALLVSPMGCLQGAPGALLGRASSAARFAA